MSSRNPLSRFHSLTPTGRQYLATVIDHRDDGRSLVEALDGTQTVVEGQNVAESKIAIVQNGKIIGQAASLPVINVELF
jgi:hypothetical protein